MKKDRRQTWPHTGQSACKYTVQIVDTWTRLITNTLYEHAEVNSLQSNMQAGFQKKNAIQQLQNVLITLEDAKLYKQDIYALIVDFTSAFNTTDHDKLFDLGFPTDAIDVVKTSSTHQNRAAFGLHGRHPSWKRNNLRRHTLSIPVPDIHGAAASLAPCRQQGIHARPCWYQHTQHQSHKLHQQWGFCRRPDLSLRLLPKSPAPSHETYPIRRLGSPHNFRQKDETIAMRTKFCVASIQWPTLHTTSWPSRS